MLNGMSFSLFSQKAERASIRLAVMKQLSGYSELTPPTPLTLKAMRSSNS